MENIKISRKERLTNFKNGMKLIQELKILIEEDFETKKKYFETIKNDYIPAKERYYLNLYTVEKIDYPYLYSKNCRMDGSKGMLFTSPYNIEITSKFKKGYRFWNHGEAEKEDESARFLQGLFKSGRVKYL